MKPCKMLLTFYFALALFAPTANAANIFNCLSFAQTGACSVDQGGSTANFLVRNGGNLSGSIIDFIPANSTHNGYGLWFHTVQNIQAFTESFTFIPNGQNFAPTFQNATTNPGQIGNGFSSGAGCEGGFYQAHGIAPNNLFSLELDNVSWQSYPNEVFSGSSVQAYPMQISPCDPNDAGDNYYPTNKIPTAPVQLNSPANTPNTTTGHVYSVLLVYTGTNLTMHMFDTNVTGATCSPVTSGTCFNYTWNGINIPSLVGANTAYVGFTGGINIGGLPQLSVTTWSYTVLSPAATPTLSPAAGTYTGTQSVTISDSSSGAIRCYNTIGAPATDGISGCLPGSTLYSGPISVAAGQTIYAVAGGTGYADSAIGSAAYKIGSTASQPTFSVSTGRYNGNQWLLLKAAQGSVICWNTTGSPASNGTTGCTTGTLYSGPITVSASETVFASAGGTGLTNSSVGSAALTINPYWDHDPSHGALSADPPPTNSPTFSPLPGSYAAAQNVTLASTTPGANICYVLSATTPAFLPQVDNQGGCIKGTPYAGAISVSSSQTLYAMAGTTLTSAPSSLTVGTYVIGGAPPPPPPSAGACDVNQDGLVNAADVQSAVNQVLGIATCGTADLQSNGQCTAVDVQRVVNAVLGGQCVTGL